MRTRLLGVAGYADWGLRLLPARALWEQGTEQVGNAVTIPEDGRSERGGQELGFRKDPDASMQKCQLTH